MRGFALTDALSAVAVISLILVTLVARSPDLQLAEADRRVRTTLIDAAQAALVLSQPHTTGTWVLYGSEQSPQTPSVAFQYMMNTLQFVPKSDYQLTLRVDARGADQYISQVTLQLDQDVVYQQEVIWSDRPGI